MNKMLAAISVLAVGGGLSLCDVCGAPRSAVASELASLTPAANGPAAPAVSAAETRMVTFKVDGMTCGGCVIAAIKTLGYTATVVPSTAT